MIQGGGCVKNIIYLLENLPFSQYKIFPALVKKSSGKMDTCRAKTKSSSTTASIATHCLVVENKINVKRWDDENNK
ncbi:unnamed protein product [Camellia sinensis]